jgi:hypothetical protein
MPANPQIRRRKLAEELIDETTAVNVNEFELQEGHTPRYLASESNAGTILWFIQADTLDEIANELNISDTSDVSEMFVHDLDTGNTYIVYSKRCIYKFHNMETGETFTPSPSPTVEAATPPKFDTTTLLIAAATMQSMYWDALRELEAAIGCDLEDVGDLAGLTVQDVIDSFGPDGFGGVDAPATVVQDKEDSL